MHYAKVHVDGCVWDYRIPTYLDGKLACGDIVVVEAPVLFEFGEVRELVPYTTHRDAHVRTIVDKVKTKRFTKYEANREARRLLLEDMAKRNAELEALKDYEAAAKTDGEMKSLLNCYKQAAE